MQKRICALFLFFSIPCFVLSQNMSKITQRFFYNIPFTKNTTFTELENAFSFKSDSFSVVKTQENEEGVIYFTTVCETKFPDPIFHSAMKINIYGHQGPTDKTIALDLIQIVPDAYLSSRAGRKAYRRVNKITGLKKCKRHHGYYGEFEHRVWKDFDGDGITFSNVRNNNSNLLVFNAHWNLNSNSKPKTEEQKKYEDSLGITALLKTNPSHSIFLDEEPKEKRRYSSIEGLYDIVGKKMGDSILITFTGFFNTEKGYQNYPPEMLPFKPCIGKNITIISVNDSVMIGKVKNLVQKQKGNDYKKMNDGFSPIKMVLQKDPGKSYQILNENYERKYMDKNYDAVVQLLQLQNMLPEGKTSYLFWADSPWRWEYTSIIPSDSFPRIYEAYRADAINRLKMKTQMKRNFCDSLLNGTLVCDSIAFERMLNNFIGMRTDYDAFYVLLTKNPQLFFLNYKDDFYFKLISHDIKNPKQGCITLSDKELKEVYCSLFPIAENLPKDSFGYERFDSFFIEWPQLYCK
jgi:hypothetical protein